MGLLIGSVNDLNTISYCICRYSYLDWRPFSRVCSTGSSVLCLTFWLTLVLLYYFEKYF